MQPNLFGSEIEVTEYQQAYIEANVDDGDTIVSSAQRKIMALSPFAYFFRDKSLEEIENIHKTKSNYYYKRSNTVEGARRLSDWYSAMWAGQTIALDNAYRSVDKRFIAKQTGEFYLIDQNDKQTKVAFTFEPDHFGSQSRTTLPTPYFEFKSDVATEFSETGYQSHFIQFIPYHAVTDFNDLLIQILRVHLNVKSTILFENTEFRNNNQENKNQQTIPVNTFCEECGEINFKCERTCPSCGANLDEKDFEEQDFTDEIAVYATV